MPGAVRWTADMDRLLSSMWARNMLIPEISKAIGKTIPAVTKRARTLGLKKRRRPGVQLHKSPVAFYVPTALYWQARAEAKRRRISMSNYLRGLLEADLAKNKPSGEVAESG